MVLSVVSRVYSFEVDNYTDDLVSSRQEENIHLHSLLYHINTVRFRMKAEWGKSCSKADLSKQKGNGPVSYNSTHTFGPVH